MSNFRGRFMFASKSRHGCNTVTGEFFTKGWISYLLPFRKIQTIKLFVSREQIRLSNSKTTDWYYWRYSRHHQKLKFLIWDLLFTRLRKTPDAVHGNWTYSRRPPQQILNADGLCERGINMGQIQMKLPLTLPYFYNFWFRLKI